VTNIYKENGFKNRNEYLNCLADEHGVDIFAVESLAELLGENEDFDGLVAAISEI
jgi:hypothetical protein